MKKQKEHKHMGKRIVLGAMFLILAAVCITIYQNTTIVVSNYLVESEKITSDFDGYQILQLTDLHSTTQSMVEKTVAIVNEQKPDLIVITGDLIDSTVYNKELQAYNAGETGEIPGTRMLQMLEQIKEVAPIYFIYGNHEMMLLDDPQNNSFKVALEEMGVQILNINNATITKGNTSINLLGIQDPATLYKDTTYAYVDSTESRVKMMLNEVTDGVDTHNFTILLSHRPEYFEVYQEYDIDLALTGHAHGGQFRIPFIGGIYAPNQGYFPTYDKGVYESDNFKMIVGVGIGNSKIPVRIFNTPEIVVVTLKTK